MKKSLQVFVFVLALSTAFLLAQSPNSGSSAPGGMGSTPSAQTGNPGGQPANPSSNPDMTNPAPTASQQPKVDDDTLHRQVHEQLATNPDLQNVDIAVSNGKVSLTGTVPSKNDKKEAKKLAKSVPGVMGVKDELTVSASNSPAAGSSSVGTSAGSNSTTGVSGTSPSSSSPSSGSMNENPPTTANPNNTPNASPSTPPSNPPQSFMHNNFMGEQSGSQSSSASDQNSAQSSTSPSATPSTPSADQSQAPAGSQSSPPSASTSPSSPSSTPSATDQSGSSPAIGSPAGQTASTTGAGESSDQVKTDIQTAFRNEPTLTSSGVSVDVSADSIALNGSVPSQKDRDEAKRIAQSFAGNRKVVDNVKVSGMGSGTSDMNSPSANPSPNPAPDTGMQQNQSNPEQPSVPKKN